MRTLRLSSFVLILCATSSCTTSTPHLSPERDAGTERDFRTQVVLDATANPPIPMAESSVDGSTRGADGSTALAALCVATGGTISMAPCCGTAPDFPDTCRVGACGCSPANSKSTPTCVCPAGSCFTRETGCSESGRPPRPERDAAADALVAVDTPQDSTRPADSHDSSDVGPVCGNRGQSCVTTKCCSALVCTSISNVCAEPFPPPRP